MNLVILGMGLVFWCGAFILHVVIWRMARPVDDLRALVAIFFIIPLVASVGAVYFGAQLLLDAVLSLLLAWFIGAAYVFWYPAAQAASPTMLICVLVGKSGKNGYARDVLPEAISAELLTEDTFKNLFAERFASLEEVDAVRLAPRGRRTLKGIRAIRHLAGFQEPKG